MQENNLKESVYKPISLRNWFTVITHTHSRLGSLAWVGEDTGLMQNWQDGKMATRVLGEALKNTGARTGGFSFVDSDHAAHSLDSYHPQLFPGKSKDEVREARRQGFAVSNLDQTVKLISERVLARAKIIEEYRTREGMEVYTGVEADLLDASGKLDVTTEVLTQLDWVGASYHPGEWKDANKGKTASLQDMVEAYEAVVTNPGVDVLNHFIRELDRDAVARITTNISIFDNLFRIMSEQNKCLEINIRDLINPDRSYLNELFLQLASRAKMAGVEFTIGFDFHSLVDYISAIELGSIGDERFFMFESEAVAYERTIELALSNFFSFDPDKSSLPNNFIAFLKPIRAAIRDLQQSGLNPNDIINGSREKFADHVSQRKREKQLMKDQMT